jgi:hypothetical protein
MALWYADSLKVKELRKPQRQRGLSPRLDPPENNSIVNSLPR